MINKAVYSYWNYNKSFLNSSGFEKFRDMLASYCLSILTSKKHFEEVELVTDDFGKSVFIDKLKLPISCNLEINNWRHIDKCWWGFIKIISYSIQKEPFIHVDGDAFIWDKPSHDFLNSKLCFQSIESPIDEGWYSWYTPLLQRAKKAVKFPQLVWDNMTDHAFNCGVAGGNDLETFQEWKKLAVEYNFSPENKDYFNSIKDVIIHQNLLSEQYFIAALSKSKGYKVNEDVKFLLDYSNLHEEANKAGQRFTHLWGLTKRDSFVIEKVYKRLQKDFPEYYEKVMNF